ncbi:MAG: hypothetical protein L0Y62_07710, partial [Nitrospirae bacterium]|nr:hypothetical protein [Nitrospirota bacterium]
VRGSVYWGPGYVGWVYTPQYVSWVPLAPGEVYHGYGHYGANSVNIINININKTEIKTVYKNVHINNAVTIVHRDAFLKGNHARVKINANPFLSEKINIGSPRIAPQNEAHMPGIKKIFAVPKRDQETGERQIFQQRQSAPAGNNSSIGLAVTPQRQVRTNPAPSIEYGKTRPVENIEGRLRKPPAAMPYARTNDNINIGSIRKGVEPVRQSKPLHDIKIDKPAAVNTEKGTAVINRNALNEKKTGIGYPILK